MGVRADIAQGLADRLATITNANGYTTNVQRVYYDKIPMGLELEDHELPAILLIAGNDPIERQTVCVNGNWQFFIQMVHMEVTDAVMFEFSREVFKAIYADSPTAMRTDAFRTIDSNIYDIEPVIMEPDLNMINANRFGIIEINIRYRTKMYDL